MKTKFSSQQIYDFIANNTNQLDHLRFEFFYDNTKEYESKTSINSFEVRKIGSYRTSLLVFAKGVIEELDSEIQIEIKICPSLSAILFYSFWFGFVTFISIMVLWVGLTRDLKALLFLFVPGSMLFFASRDVSFRRESEELKNFLSNLLDTKIVEV